MSRESKHTCHAEACVTHVPPSMFMCKSHWFTLPKALRDEVWDEYVFGQEDRMDPTSEYLEVTQRAIEFVAAKEGRRDSATLPFAS